LKTYADEEVRSQRNWPGTPLALRNALERLAPNLRMVGVEVQFGERDGTRKRNRIVRVRKMSSAPSTVSITQQGEQLVERTTADGPAEPDGVALPPSSGNLLKSRLSDGTDAADGPALISDQTDDIEVEL
jgi:hypothetical protein